MTRKGQGFYGLFSHYMLIKVLPHRETAMSVIYGLIPGMIILGLVGVLVFFWAVKNGKYEDMEGPAHRILDDDDIQQADHKHEDHPL